MIGSSIFYELIQVLVIDFWHGYCNKDFNQQLSLAANIAPSPNEQTKQTKKGFWSLNICKCWLV